MTNLLSLSFTDGSLFANVWCILFFLVFVFLFLCFYFWLSSLNRIKGAFCVALCIRCKCQDAERYAFKTGYAWIVLNGECKLFFTFFLREVSRLTRWAFPIWLVFAECLHMCLQHPLCDEWGSYCVLRWLPFSISLFVMWVGAMRIPLISDTSCLNFKLTLVGSDFMNVIRSDATSTLSLFWLTLSMVVNG